MTPEAAVRSAPITIRTVTIRRVPGAAMTRGLLSSTAIRDWRLDADLSVLVLVLMCSTFRRSWQRPRAVDDQVVLKLALIHRGERVLAGSEAARGQCDVELGLGRGHGGPAAAAIT